MGKCQWAILCNLKVIVVLVVSRMFAHILEIDISLGSWYQACKNKMQINFKQYLEYLYYKIICNFKQHSKWLYYRIIWYSSKCSDSETHISVSLMWFRVYDVTEWWRHQMETFSALLAICAANSPASGEFPAQRPMTRSFDVSFDLCLNKWLRKQSWGWLFETPSCPLWRHCKDPSPAGLLAKFTLRM